MKSRLSILLIASFLAGCTSIKSNQNLRTSSQSVSPQSAENFSQAVAFVPTSMFVDPSNKKLDDFVVTAQLPKAEAQLRAKLATLPEFPNNSYSGCHVRAHFDYLQLKEIEDANIYKVWLFSSALVSPALGGSISFTPENGNKASWDYHVAVAYTDNNQNEWILDRLISEEPMLISDWVGQFEINGYAVLTRMPPESYLFNKSTVPASDPVNYPNGFLAHFIPKNVFNGTFYPYAGDSAAQHWGASDLAADSLSSSLQNGDFPSCEWKEIASQTLELKLAVAKNQIPLGCEEAKNLFSEQFEVWVARGL
ncbi:protein-glutamine glutaminase family protein [Aliikangiella coralliicola]|uniref:Protein glutaminase domain-containing protein n=1 Tax=Aliikangiella coralliicola TaxID=2592383 RepID=A0A545UFJ6_9GAMM|nr:protein-glutamine glutaminase family protein [Aliikangiella coralliicola]TQV88246.1 hypothetical protein FLL46_06890 [Aliikangiella coralliicola]